jgi:hypothetical protein
MRQNLEMKHGASPDVKEVHIYIICFLVVINGGDEAELSKSEGGVCITRLPPQNGIAVTRSPNGNASRLFSPGAYLAQVIVLPQPFD